MKTVVLHHQVKSADDVDEWLNEHGLSLSQVQISFMYNPRGSKYMIFYQVEVQD